MTNSHLNSDKEPNLKGNLIYSTLLTLSTYLVPLVVFPYISRVLGPENVGAVDSIDSIINYFVQFSMMGLMTVGVREVARAKGDSQKLADAFSSLFLLNMTLTILSAAVLVGLVFLTDIFLEKREYLFVGLTKLCFNLFLVEWFFRGMERFRYITIRSIAVRLAFVAAVFLFVKESSDSTLYYILFVSMTAANSLLNWFYKRKFVRLSFKNLMIKALAPSFFLLGLFSVCSSIYTYLNVFYLDVCCGDAQAGFFTTSTRLYYVVMALFTSVTGVLIPRISVLIEEKRTGEVHSILGKAFLALFLFTLPVIIFFLFFPADVVGVFAGSEFLEAVSPMRIVMFMLLIIGVEQILIIQVIVPNKMDLVPLVCALAGAAVCCTVNFLITERMGAVGSALSWLCAEVTTMTVAYCVVRRRLNIIFPLGLFFKSLIWSVPYAIIGFLLYLWLPVGLLRIVVSLSLFFLYFVFLEERIVRLGLIGKVMSLIKTRVL